MQARTIIVALGAVVLGLLALQPLPARASPVVFGKTVTTYANVSLPVTLTAGPDGVLYVGNGYNNGPTNVWRVSPSGTVTAFGSGLTDPDAVLLDQTGQFTGTAGTLLVGGGPGYIWAVDPNGNVETLFHSDDFNNPQDMIFDQTGRLIFVDADDHCISQTGNKNDPPTVLATCPSEPLNIVADPNGRLFVSGVDGVIRVYDPSGVLLDDHFADLGSPAHSEIPMAFGPGRGGWTADLYAISNAGDLLRIDASGNASIVGTGFDQHYPDMIFVGNSLMISSFSEEKIIEVLPEPATLSLLALGALAMLRPRRKK